MYIFKNSQLFLHPLTHTHKFVLQGAKDRYYNAFAFSAQMSRGKFKWVLNLGAYEIKITKYHLNPYITKPKCLYCKAQQMQAIVRFELEMFP